MMQRFLNFNGLGARAVAALVAVLTAVMMLGAPAQASQPKPWEMGLQPAASPVMESIHSFHTFILVIITVITLFVLALLIYVMVRFNERSNPEPSKTSHNTLIEVVWTVVPILVLLVIAVPSFRLLFLELDIPEPDLTIKATGYQWYWSYEYPDAGELAFDSLMLQDDELKDGQPRLLSVDNEVVVPVGKNVKVLVTAADVIHNWAMPAFGVKMDAIPGRLNETWFRADKPGVYHGQCSELCGKDHAFMPIVVRAVSEEEFAAWLEKAKEQFASAPAPVKVAEPKLFPVEDAAQEFAVIGLTR